MAGATTKLAAVLGNAGCAINANGSLRIGDRALTTLRRLGAGLLADRTPGLRVNRNSVTANPEAAGVLLAGLLGSVTYFASGSNAAGEIQGFAAVGMNPGVCACALHPAAIDALKALAGTGTRVFVDSGAFGEVGFGPEGLIVKAPITDEEWDERLGLYEELAAVLGSQVYVVAPDRVGSQEETLVRLARYAGRMQRIAALGANVIVVCQRGAVPQADFFARAAAAVGLPVESVIAGIPSKKAAATTAEIAAFARDAQPRRAHLLGLGPRSPRYAEVVAAVRAASPATVLFCDSVALTAVVGHGTGTPRPLTAALARAAEAVEVAMWDEGADGVDYTDCVVEDVDGWMDRASRARLADAVGADRDARAAILSSPAAWLATETDDQVAPGEQDWVLAAVDAEWQTHSRRRTGTWRKRSAVVAVFSSAVA